jgi:cytochrome b
MSDKPVQPVRVWDLPTRLFHWALVCCVALLVITGHVGGDALPWHFRFGYGVLALLAFRLIWGVVGGRWSRFASFVYAPATVWRYLRGQHGDAAALDVGHSPAGSLSVFSLLALLLLQVGTGLFADDEIASTGPLNRYVSHDTGLLATRWHKDWGQWILIGLVSLHVAAIVFYRVRRGMNLVRPMLLGDKQLPADTPASADGITQRVLAVVIVALCAALSAWVSALGG